MSENIIWKIVLNKIYRKSPDLYGIGKKGLGNEHPLAVELGISGEDLRKAIYFLIEMKLLEYDHQHGNWLIVTEKGFNVAWENEKHKSTLIFTEWLVVLTGILAFNPLIMFLSKMGISPLWTEGVAVSIIIIVLLILTKIIVENW